MALREVRERLDPRVLLDPRETLDLKVPLEIPVPMELMELEDLSETLVPRVGQLPITCFLLN